ncbi:MAG: isochorismatase family protein [Betaproteobacteria bacterium]
MARIWDAFLTESDRAYDAQNPTFSDKRELGRRPALVLIDLYRLAFGDRPEPLLEAVRHNRSHLGLAGWNALPHLRRLLDAARAAGIAVIHVTREVEISEWDEVGRADRTPTAEQRTERERQYAIVEQLAPRPGEPVLRKRSASVFGSTAIASVLVQLHVDTVIIAGESTSGCVRAAVVDARDLRYPVVVVEECVFDRTEASHAINLYDMHRKYAHVLSLAETLDYLSSVDK